MLNKIAIVHFQPVEKYPPVMNVINSISRVDNVICNVYTTHNKSSNWFNANNANIHRISKQHQSSLLRYLGYVKFNVGVFFSLFIKRPQSIIAFETYSVLPVYLYKKIFTKTTIIIHHHEYVSLSEIKSSSSYTKFLHLVEKKLYVSCNFISQTNDQRLQLFLSDNPFIDINKTLITPNFPPSNWYQFAQLNKKENKTGITKLVHVGAISLHTMHTQKIVQWVINQNGKYQIDFYTNNIATDAKLFFDKVNNENVRLFGGENYFELPQLLINYDIGLTLYNGHIPNYVYNVPNKVLEYLACGLNVWYSSELISTETFVEENAIRGCFKTNFDQIKKNDELKFFNENTTFKKLLISKNRLVQKALNSETY